MIERLSVLMMVTQPERDRLDPKSSHSKYSFHHVIAARLYNEELKDESDIDSQEVYNPQVRSLTTF